MNCEEIRVNMRETTPEEIAENRRLTELMFKLNHTMMLDDEYQVILKEIFGDNLGEGSMVAAPISGACVNNVKMGKNCFINSNALLMARGGITLEDNVIIAANVQILTNNHDLDDLNILTCKPVLIKESA